MQQQQQQQCRSAERSVKLAICATESSRCHIISVAAPPA